MTTTTSADIPLLTMQKIGEQARVRRRLHREAAQLAQSRWPQTDTPSSGQDKSFAAAGAIAGSPSTGTQNSIPKPTIIALLAMNGLLVIGVLLLGGLWISDRRSTPSRSREYKKVDATRGLDHDSYYDAPDLPPKRM
ncbi:hypothetical protein B0H13DRAFT_2649285 [Mycena leptocephala]|nr:hypothetical protein B0H13DRAFT_2649285 [Mycena leptocephala]